jgi:hypothetical protein
LRPSAAAVEAEKHHPKVSGKKQESGDQLQGGGKEEFDSPKQLPDAHNEEFQDQLRVLNAGGYAQKMSQLQTPIQDILIFFSNSP